MRVAFAWLLLCFTTSIIASSFEHLSTSCFTGSSYSKSAGGKAVCTNGNLAVSLNATNERILYAEPPDQFSLTETFVEYLQVDSSLLASINGGNNVISGTWNINARFCRPATTSVALVFTSIQLLIHGIGYDKSYWDLAPGYSYIDAAAEAGYATFSYDRLGVGSSDHPDPIQDVQASLQVEIVHSIIQSLRSGVIGGQNFANVIGIGHSFGSIQAVGLAVRYPHDLDAIILQGLSVNTNALGLTIAGLSSAIAAQNQPNRFGSLPTGYMVTNAQINNQLAFFHYPNFDPSLFYMIDERKQTYTLGEVFTLTTVISPAPKFTGPVNVVLGLNDFIFCQGNCIYPVDQSAQVKGALFPAASTGSQKYLVNGTGHAINAHYNAQEAFTQMINFIQANDFTP